MLVSKPCQLIILTFRNGDGFYLIHLDEQGEEMTDTFHDSIEDAMEQAQLEFNVTADQFEPVT